MKIEISMEFVPKGLIDNRSTLAQVMVWHWTGDKHQPESVLTQLTNACNYVTLGGYELIVEK